VGGAAFFYRQFGVGFVEAEDEKHAPAKPCAWRRETEGGV